ncbi:MAG TPA: methionyl-tRNA formyltransferase [Actinomycetota bacterium]|nr:methionyl-tRNA formyltransferase [Actinomycetota bacterium]
MRTVFFGTPAWAVPSLDALLDGGVEVAAVVTNPDRPTGRGLRVRPSPVKERAVAARLDVLQPARARDPDLAAALVRASPDVAVVVAYGKILPRELLEVPPLGFVNVHFSVLPGLRGAAPVQRALLEGLEETGVSLFVLTEGMDEGPVLTSAPERVAPDDSAATLGARLAHRGAELLVPTLHAYAAGELVARPQDHARATYAPKIAAAETRVDWSAPAAAVDRLARALDPDPGAWTTLRDARLRVFRVAAVGDAGLAPGELRFDGRLLAGAGDGAVELVEVQPAGKRRMGGADLGRGLRPAPGERLR